MFDIGALLRAEGVDDFEVVVLAAVPAVFVDIGSGALGHGFAFLRVAEEVEHFAGESVGIAGFEETHHRVVEVVAVDGGGRDDDRDSDRHEFHDLGAVGLVPERLGALRDHAEIGIRHDAGDLAQAPSIEEADAPIQAGLLGLGDESRPRDAIAVDVELGLGKLGVDLLEGLEY